MHNIVEDLPTSYFCNHITIHWLYWKRYLYFGYIYPIYKTKVCYTKINECCYQKAIIFLQCGDAEQLSYYITNCF